MSVEDIRVRIGKKGKRFIAICDHPKVRVSSSGYSDALERAKLKVEAEVRRTGLVAKDEYVAMKLEGDAPSYLRSGGDVPLPAGPARRSECAGISVDPAVCHGMPCVKGTRVMVSVVLDCLLAGMDEAAIRAQYPSLKEGDVASVLAYASALAKSSAE